MSFSVEDIKNAVTKITSDKALMDQFQKDPVKAVESVIGVDLPDDVVNKVVEAVKTKEVGDKLSGGLDAIKKLF